MMRKVANFLKNNHELELLEKGYEDIVGIDEVGRGCLAGPVYVTGYKFNLKTPFLEGINDSKKVPVNRRETLYKVLKEHSFYTGIGQVQDINSFGIARVIEKLIAEIVAHFKNERTFFIVDGRFTASFGQNTLKVIKADATYYSVAAASIIAKVQRDSFMKTLDNAYPGFYLAKNKGYGTKEHINALLLNGSTDLHRAKFIEGIIAKSLISK